MPAPASTQRRARLAVPCAAHAVAVGERCENAEACDDRIAAYRVARPHGGRNPTPAIVPVPLDPNGIAAYRAAPPDKQAHARAMAGRAIVRAVSDGKRKKER